MSIVIITGSGGLIGAEAVKFLSKKFSKVIGIDNDMRSYFFGKSASVKKNIKILKSNYKNYSHYNMDIRNFRKLRKIFKTGLQIKGSQAHLAPKSKPKTCWERYAQ